MIAPYATRTALRERYRQHLRVCGQCGTRAAAPCPLGMDLTTAGYRSEE